MVVCFLIMEVKVVKIEVCFLKMEVEVVKMELIKLAYNNNHAKSSVWAISGQFNVLPFGEITAAMGG